MFGNENIMFLESIGTSTVVDQETMILILYLLRSTMVITWSIKLQYETMVNQGHETIL